MTHDEMVQYALEHPVRSDHHQWAEGQQADYDRLRANGRRLYDNLRTQFPEHWDHDAAYDRALEEFGAKEQEPCCYPWYQTRHQQHAYDCPEYP